MPATPEPTPPSLDEIYRELQRGAGHQWVNDENVQALIDMAMARRHRLIEVQLREWRASCAPSEEDEEGMDPGQVIPDSSQIDRMSTSLPISRIRQ